MADLLRFRKGLFKNLPETRVPGTIYVTTDEKAMYVDVGDGANDRIRIGDFIRVNTVKDITPPFSETSLYYVEADNALVCYQEHVGEDGQKVGAWKQINGTAEIKAQIAGLQTSMNEASAKVNAIEGNITNLINNRIVPIEKDLDESKEGSLASRVVDLEDTIGDANGGLVKEVNALKEAVGMDDAGNVEGLAGTVLEHSQKIAANTEEIANTNAALAALSNILTKDYMLSSDIDATYAKKSELEGLLDAEGVNDLLDTKGYATTTYVDNAKADVITTADEKYAPLSEYNTLSAVVNTLTGEGGSVAAAQKAADEAKQAINDYKVEHQGDYTNPKIDELVEDAKKAGTKAQNTADANAQSIASINAKIADIEGKEGQPGLIDTKVNAAKSELEDKIAEEINAVNAMEYVEGVSKAEDLPATAKNGATYVAEEKFDLGAKQVYPGDLLIATGDEDEETGEITAPTWTVVKTGYDASLEQILTGSENKITLSSPIGSAHSVEFVGAGAMKVEITGNAANFGIYWDDFE